MGALLLPRIFGTDYHAAFLWLGIIALVIASLIIGAACLRVSGVYTALLTLAIVFVMQLLIMTDTACFRPMETGGCEYFTGGTMSLTRYGDLGALLLAETLVQAGQPAGQR